MDQLEIITARVQALEAIAQSHRPSVDHGTDLKRLNAKLDGLSADIAALNAIAKRIPSIEHLATKQDVSNSINEVAEVIATQSVRNDEASAKRLQSSVNQTVGEIHAQTLAAKNVSATFARFAADMLVSKATTFGL